MCCLPIADAGDCSVEVTIIVIGTENDPSDNITPISIYPTDSIARYISDVKLTIDSVNFIKI